MLAAFNAANQYADTFEPYRDFYRENESCDLKAVRQEEHCEFSFTDHLKDVTGLPAVDTSLILAPSHCIPAVNFFDEALERYHSQHKMADAIIEKRPLGMLLIDAVQMKGQMTPSPLRCLDVINDILPVKARKEVDRLIAELQDAQFKLEFVPSTTVEYVDSLNFLDEIQERVSLVA